MADSDYDASENGDTPSLAEEGTAVAVNNATDEEEHVREVIEVSFVDRLSLVLLGYRTYSPFYRRNARVGTTI